MYKSVWVFAVAGIVSVLPARAGQLDVAEVAQDLAQSVEGAHSAAGRDGQGRTKWAGIWMEEAQVCEHGKLNPAGSRVVQAGQRYSREHGARLTLFTPPEHEQALRRDLETIAPEVALRLNALIGRHCYLVIGE